MTSTITVLESTYQEALSLVEEARAYAYHAKKRDSTGLNAVEKMTQTMEALRVTTRLTNVMSWLLARKAVHAGEMTAEEAVEQGYTLAGQGLCLEEGPMEAPFLSDRLKDLMLRSLELYQRVERLDRQLRGEARAGYITLPGALPDEGPVIAHQQDLPPAANVVPLRRAGHANGGEDG